jgi:HlyD family secretion protein
VRRRWRAALLAIGAAGLGTGCGDGVPRAVGTLERDRIELIAEASEPILAIPVREGDAVAAGDLVVRLDPERFAARARRAEGARDLAQARLDELARGPRRERIAEGRARLAGAEGVYETARQELARAKELAAQDVASASRLDTQRARFDEARAERDAARAALDALLEGTTAEELDQARAGLVEA